MSKANNQNFVSIPYTQLNNMIKYKAKLNRINVVFQEESYTSKASFFDRDFVPVYKKDNTEKYDFSGRRVHRGLYKTASGFVVNADVNGALNIMLKYLKSNFEKFDFDKMKELVVTPRRVLRYQTYCVENAKRLAQKSSRKRSLRLFKRFI